MVVVLRPWLFCTATRVARFKPQYTFTPCADQQRSCFPNHIVMAFWRPNPANSTRPSARLASLLALCGLLVAVAAPTATAQSRESDTPSHAITVNPFFVLAGWISGEYEQRVNSTVTLGGGFSYVDFSDNRYTNFELKGRLYPNENALRGFEMALSLGVTHLTYDSDHNDCVFDASGQNASVCSPRKSVTTPAIGLEFGYQWLLGSSGRTALALGGGGKRFLASKADLDGTTRVIPTFRIGIGYAW